MKILIIFLLTISQVYAVDITPVKKGDIVKQDGYFVDEANIKKFRKINEDKKLLEDENLSLKKLRVLDQDITVEYKQRYHQTSKDLQWEQTKSTWKLIGGFALGVLITGALGYAAVRVSK